MKQYIHTDETQQSSSETNTENTFKEDSLELATMTFKEKQRYKKERRNKRMATMTRKERILYIIQYYKWHFIIGLFAIICLAYTGKIIYRASQPTLLYLAIINNTDNTTINEYLPEAYRKYYNLDDKNHIEIRSDLYVSSTEDTTQVGTEMTDYQTIGYYNMYGKLDVIICDKEALQLYASSDDTTAIDLSMDTELYNQIKDNVITMSDPEGIKNDGRIICIVL